MYRLPENFWPDMPTYRFRGRYFKVSATGREEPTAAPAAWPGPR